MSSCLVTLVSAAITEMYIFMSQNDAGSRLLTSYAQSFAAGMPCVLICSMHGRIMQGHKTGNAGQPGSS